MELVQNNYLIEIIANGSSEEVGSNGVIWVKALFTFLSTILLHFLIPFPIDDIIQMIFHTIYIQYIYIYIYRTTQISTKLKNKMFFHILIYVYILLM